MPKQQMVATGRRSKPQPKAARRPRPNTLDLRRDSATPGGNEIGPRPRLKVHPPKRDDQDQQDAAALIGPYPDEEAEQRSGDAMEEDEDELPVAQGARRSGRATKPTRHNDFLYSDIQIDQSSVGKMDDGYTEAGHQEQLSSPLTIYNESPSKSQHQKRKSGRPRGSKNSKSPLASVPEEFPCEHAPDFSSPSPENARKPTKFEPESEVYNIVAQLSGQARIHIDLPNLIQVGTNAQEKPYSAQFLMELYIVAYQDSKWNLCDLIADTWIRALHTKRRQEESRGKEDELTWRFNSALYSRRSAGKKGFDSDAPSYSRELHVEDPQLEPDVANFSRELLDTLYNQTDRQCKARNLWADAMALSGSKLESQMQIDKRQHKKWNESLVYDIMCTTLRMARRKLTLKIEEATEGAWCKRYHMHTAQGRPCYRKLAYDRKVAGGDSSDEDEAEDVPTVLVMEPDVGMASKRGHGDRDSSTAEMRTPKRVRSEAPVVVDEDAEGETDDG